MRISKPLLILKILTILSLPLTVYSCHKLEEDYSFNMYYKHKVDNFNTINKNSDIPLAKGLEILNSEHELTYSTNSENIISISFVTQKDVTKIKDFYLQTLPQLGWRLTNNEEYSNLYIIDFTRDDETLEIEFAKGESRKIITFYAQLRS